MNHWESLRITKNCPKNVFKVVHESARITENRPKIIGDWFENHIKNKVLPLQWLNAKWHRFMKIIVFIIIFSDSHWFCESFSFSHSVKTTGIDHIAISIRHVSCLISVQYQQLRFHVTLTAFRNFTKSRQKQQEHVPFYTIPQSQKTVPLVLGALC